MDHLIEEASSIRRILPWIKSEQDIVNYLRKIPLDKNHLRIHLTILHFLKLRDREDDADFERLIEDDAREIVSILPGTPYKDIKDQLTVMGNMPNRQEAVIRQLLLPKHELKVLVSEIDVNNVSKEKPKSIFQSVVKKDVHNETNTDIKIRIRKVKGALEVVSRFKQEKVPASSKWDTRPNYVVDIPSTVEENSSLSDSDDLPHSSTHNSSISSPNLVQNLGVEKVAAQCSDSTKPSSINSTMKDNNHEPIPFDLVGYLKEVTQAADEKIISICREARVPLNQRPHVGILNDLLNKVLTNEVIELDSSHDTDEEMSIDDRAEDTRELESVPSTSSDSRDHNSGLKSVTSTSSDSRGHKSALESVPSTSTDPRVTINTFRPDPSTSWRDLGSHILPIIDPPQAGGLHTNPLNRPLIKPATLTHEPKSSRIEPLMEVESTRKRSAGKNELGVLPNYVMDVNPESHPLDYSKWPLKEVDPDGSSTVKKRKVVDEKLVLRLIEMFPQACPNFIRSVSENRKWSEFDDVVTVILSTENYPLRQQRAPSPPVEVDLEEQLEIVKALLPDADPTYLRCMCETIGNDTERLNEFICTAREAKDYPTMKEYLRKQKLSAQSKQYTTDFSVENFVQLFPEPEKTFTDPKRTVQVDHYTSLYIINFFQNKYDKLPLKVIKNIISENEMRIIDIDRHMAKAALVHVMRSKRKRCHLDAPQNIMVLQELAYLTHKKEIEAFLKEKEQKENTERQNAKENGLMNTCQCCFDEEVMPKDTFNCPKGCMFCRDCIQKSCEVTLGEGKTVYKCLCDCPEEFTLQTLQNVLPPKMFSKLAQKKTLAEIQAAGIEELEMCPFCDFASIPVENDKIFRCFNPDCMKESCRLCKEENHIPYKCDELEKDEELKARLYLENKMSEALIRKCWKCGVGFFKEEGCNKMTCSCGAKMCYLCKKPVTDYSHFNGIGGDKFHLCPLYSDTNEVNRQNVVGAIEAAKADIDPSKLKVDPSANIQQHFNERKKTLPREAHLELVQNVNHFLHRHPHRRGRANIQMPRQRIMPPEEARHNAFQIVQDVPLPERPRNPPPQDPRPMAVQIVQQFLMPRGPRQVPRQGAARGMDIDQVLHHRFNRNHELGRRLIEALAMADVDREMRPRGEREVNH
nr:E3 ubiquitin-protein ligase RNF216-like isoform X7 [Leptinotarsa decemlineata]